MHFVRKTFRPAFPAFIYERAFAGRDFSTFPPPYPLTLTIFRSPRTYYYNKTACGTPSSNDFPRSLLLCSFFSFFTTESSRPHATKLPSRPPALTHTHANTRVRNGSETRLRSHPGARRLVALSRDLICPRGGGDGHRWRPVPRRLRRCYDLRKT